MDPCEFECTKESWCLPLVLKFMQLNVRFSKQYLRAPLHNQVKLYIISKRLPSKSLCSWEIICFQECLLHGGRGGFVEWNSLLQRFIHYTAVISNLLCFVDELCPPFSLSYTGTSVFSSGIIPWVILSLRHSDKPKNPVSYPHYTNMLLSFIMNLSCDGLFCCRIEQLAYCYALTHNLYRECVLLLSWSVVHSSTS